MQVESFCPPSGVNGSASTVARKAVPGQRVGAIRYEPWKVFSFFRTALDKRALLGVRRVFYRDGSDYAEVEYLRDSSGSIRRFSSLSAANQAAQCERVPRLSNLDCHDRLVKRGLKVSYQGVRGFVVRVSRGRCCVEYVDFLGRKTGSCEWLKCESLQVVS